MGGSFLWRREEKNSFRSVGTKSARLVQPQNTAVQFVFFDEREKERKKERKTARWWWWDLFLEHFNGL